MIHLAKRFHSITDFTAMLQCSSHQLQLCASVWRMKILLLRNDKACYNELMASSYLVPLNFKILTRQDIMENADRQCLELTASARQLTQSNTILNFQIMI